MKKKMQLFTLTLSLILALVPALALAAPDDVIYLPDTNFEAAVCEIIGKPIGAITQADLNAIVQLDISNGRSGASQVSSISRR